MDKVEEIELLNHRSVNAMAKIFYCSVIGCFVFISSYFSFSISFEAGIVVSALLLEFFSRCFLKDHGGVW